MITALCPFPEGGIIVMLENKHWILYGHERRWPIPMVTRARLALAHEPEASSSPDGYRLATCVVPWCKREMVSMWHLWLDASGIKKEIHMCHQCATDFFGAPTP